MASNNTLGTLSVGIDGNIGPLTASLAKAEKDLQTFAGNINNIVTTINNTFSRIAIGGNNKGFSRVLMDFTQMVSTLAQIPQQVQAIGRSIGPEVDKLVGVLSKVAPELRNAGGAMKTMAGGIDRLSDSARKLPTIIQYFQQFTQEIKQLGGQGGAGGGVAQTNNAFSTLANNLRGQVNGAFRATHNSLSLLKGGMHGAEQGSTSLIQALTGLDIPLNKMVGRIVLVNNIWKLWGATLAAWKAGVQTVIDTSQGLANIQAVTLSYGKDFVDIQKKISLTLRESIFPAKELTDAYVILGQAGFTSAEATETFDAVIRLATASMSSLSESANILTTILRTYDLQAKDSISVTNQLIAATNLSKLSIEGLNTALNFAGPAAAEAGLALNETLSALSVMADRGIKASTQGTGLRQVLAALLDPTDEFVDKMLQLGIRMDQVNPLLTDFDSILHTLKNAGFSAADAFEVLELRTAGAMNVLVAGADTFERMSDTIENSASALTAQLLQQRGLNAEIEIFKNKLYEIFLGPKSMGKWIEGTIKLMTKLLEVFRQFIDTLRTNEKLLGAIYIGMGLLGSSMALKGISHMLVASKGLWINLVGIKDTMSAIATIRTEQALAGALSGAGQVAGAAAPAAGGIGAAVGGAARASGSWLVAGGLGGAVTSLGAGISAVLSGAFQVAVVIGTIYATIKLIQYGMDKWNGEQEKTINYAEEILKREKQIEESQARRAKYQMQIDRAQAGKDPSYRPELGHNIPGLQLFNSALEDEKELREEILSLQEKQRAAFDIQFKEMLPDLLAERQALEDNRLKLESRYETLEQLAGKENKTMAERSTMLQAQIELEKFLGIQATSTEEALIQGRIALLDNTGEWEKANDQLRVYAARTQDSLDAMQKEIDLYSVSEESKDAHAGVLADLTVKSNKYAEVLALINKYLGQIPGNMALFNNAKKEYDRILSDAINTAVQSKTPVPDLEGVEDGIVTTMEDIQKSIVETRSQVDEMLGGIPAEIVDQYIDGNEEARKRIREDLEKNKGFTEDDIYSILNTSRLTTYEVELRPLLTDLTAKYEKLAEKLPEVEQKLGVARNAEHEATRDRVAGEVKRLEDELSTKSKEVKALEYQADQLQKTIKEEQLTDAERRAREERLFAIRREINEKTIAQHEKSKADMEAKAKELDTAGENLANSPNDTRRKMYTDAAQQLRDRIKGINAELEKLGQQSGLAQLDEEFDSMAANANRVFQANKLITKELEDQGTLSKKRIKSLELQVELEEGLKDLAVSAKQEQEASYRIIELKRKIAEEEYNTAQRGIEQSTLQLEREQALLDLHNAERIKAPQDQDKMNMLTQEGYDRAVKQTEEYSRQIQIYSEQTATLENKLKLLDIEAEKVNIINEAWRKTARTINEGFSEGVTDILFGDKKAETALEDYVESIKDSFKDVFKATIKSKFTLLDKPFKGNMADLGKNIVATLGGAFKDAFDIGKAGSNSVLDNDLVKTGQYGQTGIGGGTDYEITGYDAKGNPILKDLGPSSPGALGANIDWKAAGAGLVGVLGPILSEYVFKLEAGAKGLEKSLQTASKVMQGLAGVLVAFGPYGALAGAALYALSWILPMLAPDRYREFAKSEKAFMQRALLAAGGDNLLTFVPSNPTDGGRSGTFDNTTLNDSDKFTKQNDAAVGFMTNLMGSIFGTYLFPGMYKFMGKAIEWLLADSLVDLKFKRKLGEATGATPVVADITLKLIESMALIFNPLGQLLADLGVFDSLFGGGELQAVNDYIKQTAKQEGVYLQEKPGSRVRFDYDTTQAFGSKMVSRGQVTAENMTKITNAMMLMEIVKARAIKSSKAYEIGMTQVNSTLAEFLRSNYDLKKLDLDSLFGSFGASVGTFDNALAAINQVYARFKEGKGKGFDFEALQGMVEGAVFMFADSFPKGVNVARRSLQELNEKGKIELESLNDGIEELLTKVAEDAMKIAENPIKIVLETGQVDEALNDLNGQINGFIKDTLSTNVTSILSNAVIRDGFLTPITEGVQDLSQQFYDAQITAEQFGTGLRGLFQNNLIPNILNFKDILKDTFKAFSATMGFPLQTFPDLFGVDKGLGQGLSFDSRLERQKSFQQSFLGLSALSDEVSGMKQTGNSIDTLTKLLGSSLIPESAKASIVDQTYAEVVAVASQKAMKTNTFLDVDELKVEELKGAIYNWIFLHRPFTLQILKKQPTGKVQKIDVYSVDTGEGSSADLDRYSIAVDVYDVGQTKPRSEEVMLGGTNQGRTELSAASANANETRTRLLNEFVNTTGIELADIQTTAMQRFGKEIEELTPDEMFELLTMDKYRDRVDARVKEILDDIKDMDKEIRKALRQVATSLTTSEEFGAFYSSLQQSMAEGFLNEAKFTELLNLGIRTLQKTLPSAINVEDIFNESLKDGKLDAELFTGVLEKEVATFKSFGEALKGAVLSAFSSGNMVDSIQVFTNALKKSIGDAVLDGLIEGFVNRIYIDQIFGPFLQGLGTRVSAFTKGQVTIEDLMAFVNQELPGVTDAIGTAGEAINPIIATLYQLFTDTGLIDAYDSTLDKQSDLIKKQLDVANKWEDILKQARDVRSELLYGQGSPQQIRQQIVDANKDLATQMGIFRSTSDPAKRQDAASKGISLIQELFQLGNSAGQAGLGDYQKTSASFQLFTKGLIAMLDEITNAAINGASQIELLRRQVELLEVIAKNTGGIKGPGWEGGDPNRTGAQTRQERIVQGLIDAETRRYKDEQDFRLSVDWARMTQEERDNMERDWKWQHDLQTAEIDKFIDEVKTLNSAAYDAERIFRRGAQYSAMTPAQKAAWEANIEAGHNLYRDILDGFQQYLDEAEAERERYRIDEQGEPPPPGPTETEELTDATVNLTTSMDAVADILRRAYNIPEEPAPPTGSLQANLTDGSGYESLVYGPTDASAANTTQALVTDIVAKMQESQNAMIERLTTMMNNLYISKVQEIVENFAYNGAVNITINGAVDPATLANLESTIERVVIKSVRRGKIGAEVQRK